MAVVLATGCSSDPSGHCGGGSRPPSLHIFDQSEAQADRLTSVSATPPCDPVCANSPYCTAWNVDGPETLGAACTVTIAVASGKMVSLDLTVVPSAACPGWSDFSPRNVALICTPDAGAGAIPDSGCIFPNEPDAGTDGGLRRRVTSSHRATPASTRPLISPSVAHAPTTNWAPLPPSGNLAAMDAREVADLVTSARGDVRFVEREAVDALRGVSARGSSILVVDVGTLGASARGQLGEFVEAAVEEAIAARGAAAPGVGASSDRDASLSDQRIVK